MELPEGFNEKGNQVNKFRTIVEIFHVRRKVEQKGGYTEMVQIEDCLYIFNEDYNYFFKS